MIKSYLVSAWPKVLAIFAGTALGAVVFTVATVSYHGVKAALADPVESLRDF